MGGRAMSLAIAEIRVIPRFLPFWAALSIMRSRVRASPGESVRNLDTLLAAAGAPVPHPEPLAWRTYGFTNTSSANMPGVTRSSTVTPSGTRNASDPVAEPPL